MKKSLRWLSLLLIVVMLGSLFIGCGKTDDKDKVDAGDKKEDKQEDKKDDEKKDDEKKDDEKKDESEDSTLITDTPVTLTYWGALNSNASANYASLNETPLAQELERLTGVTIEYQHPPEGQADEQFNLMVGSGELPDILERGWFDYPGGQGKAIEDGVLIELNDLIDEHAPNFKKLLESDELIDKMSKTDDGKYAMFPFIRGNELNMVFYGPIMRKDWLDDLNLDIPETIDEWTEVLRKFKTEKGADAPFQGNDIPRMACAFDIVDGFYLEDGEVKYGPIEPAYKDYLAAMNKWYEEGLIDPDYAALDGTARDAKATSGESGAFFGYGGSTILRYLTAMKDEDPNYDLTGVPYPAKEKGGKAFSGQKDFPVMNPGWGITTACEEVEIATKWLDFGYSGDGTGIGGPGYMLYNFGIEGETYEIVDGYPKYTDFVTDNPDGIAMGHVLGGYTRSIYSGPMVQAREYHEQYQHLPQQIEAAKHWLKADDSHRLVPTTPTSEENEKLVDIMNEVNTYVSEQRLKFIMGQEPLEKFDEFVEQLKTLGIEDVIEIRNAALKRFNER